MPRAPSEKAKEAEKLFRKGMPLTDIAKKLEVSDGTVRSWKNRYDWDKKAKKTSATLQINATVKTLRCRRKKAAPSPVTKMRRAVVAIHIQVILLTSGSTAGTRLFTGIPLAKKRKSLSRGCRKMKKCCSLSRYSSSRCENVGLCRQSINTASRTARLLLMM